MSGATIYTKLPPHGMCSAHDIAAARYRERSLMRKADAAGVAHTPLTPEEHEAAVLRAAHQILWEYASRYPGIVRPEVTP